MNSKSKSVIISPTNDTRMAHRTRPKRIAAMKQTWRDLLFLHWRVDPDILKPTLPGGLHLDTFENEAWIGVVPFFMDNIRPSFLPPLPGLSWFLETNLRTYVYDDHGNSGVWFYSLDANQRIAVTLGKALFRLPYRYEKMNANYRSSRPDSANVTSGGVAESWIDYQYGGNHFLYRKEMQDALHIAVPGTLEFFLFERYLLFAEGKPGIRIGQVYHTPYQLCEAKCDIIKTDLFAKVSIEVPQETPDVMHFSPGVDVDVFGLTSQQA